MNSDRLWNCNEVYILNSFLVITKAMSQVYKPIREFFFIFFSRTWLHVWYIGLNDNVHYEISRTFYQIISSFYYYQNTQQNLSDP